MIYGLFQIPLEVLGCTCIHSELTELILHNHRLWLYQDACATSCYPVQPFILMWNASLITKDINSQYNITTNMLSVVILHGMNCTMCTREIYLGISYLN